MAKFKNLIVETGSFLFGESYFDFNKVFETENKDLINHLKSRDDWKEIKSDIVEEIKSDIVEEIDLKDIVLEKQSKETLIDLAASLNIPSENLSKKQLIEAINDNKNNIDDL
jgi:hypothetical protein